MKLKTFARDEWLALDKQTLKDQLELLDREYPLELYTDASRTYSTVRRMKIEKKIGPPINLVVVARFLWKLERRQTR